MRSLRVRLLMWLCLALCTLWGGVAAWMFTGMRQELRTVLDDRLIASAHMVAGIVHQFNPQNATPKDWGPMLNVIARDGVACEVSLLRSEVHAAPALQAAEGAGAASENSEQAALIPATPLQSTGASGAGSQVKSLPKVLARTEGAPSFQTPLPLGFSTMEKGGKLWRTFVLQEHGVRIATADRIDVRESLVYGFAYTTIFPFVLALLASMVLMWWGVTRGLKPLESLRQELSQRPPGDDSPVAQGHQVRELAPLVQTINHLLQRVHNALERERRWSDDAAHELRTPLTAVKTHVQVAQMAVASAGELPLHEVSGCDSPGLTNQTPQWVMARDALEHAGEGVDHLQHTLEQLLLLVRLDGQHSSSGRGSAAVSNAEPGYALESMEKAWALAATAIASGEQRLRWLPGQDLTDPQLEDLQTPVPQSLLVSALRNLLENALRYGVEANGDPAQYPVYLGLRRVPHLPKECKELVDAESADVAHIEFTVLDMGPGLSEQDCALATQRFWRKQHQAHGSGLGLAIVQRIAQSGGGVLQLMPLPQWQQEFPDSGLPEVASGLVARIYLPVSLTVVA